MLNQVRTANAESFKLGAVHSAFDPLVHGLTGDRRVCKSSGLFHAVVVAHVAIVGPSLSTGAADAETRESVT